MSSREHLLQHLLLGSRSLLPLELVSEHLVALGGPTAVLARQPAAARALRDNLRRHIQTSPRIARWAPVAVALPQPGNLSSQPP
jgi:hypothetical protein